MSASPPVGSTIFQAIRRCWLTAFVTTALVLAGLSFAISQLKPLYTSRTTLLLPFTPVTELTVRNGNVSSPQTDPTIVHSYIQVLKDDGICLAVIQQLQLDRREEFNPPPGIVGRMMGAASALISKPSAANANEGNRQERALQIYKKRLSVYNDGRSLAVDLSFQAQRPDLAAAIVNAHAEAYIAAQVQYRRREAQIKTAWIDRQVEQSAKDLRAAQVALQMHQVTARTASPFSAADESADLKFRQSIATAKQGVYESLLNRQQIMIAEQRYDGSDTRILSPALAASRPSFPSLALFGPVALLVSLMSGVGAASVADRIFGVPQPVADWLGAQDIEVLASIEIPGTSTFTLMRKLRRLRLALFVEKMRGLRSLIPSDGEDGLIVALTAGAPGQGTSLIAAQLARAVAASGVATLLLDLDLRHPKAHSFFGLVEAEHAGQSACADAVLPRERIRRIHGIEALSLLNGANGGRSSVDMLTGSAIRSALADLRRDFRVIVIDTSPVGVVWDALAVADLADQTILCCDRETADVSQISGAITALQRRRAAFRGAVVTSRKPASLGDCRALNPYVAKDVAVAETRQPGAAQRLQPIKPVIAALPAE